jgi:regulator of protease activity HflC (stomatin/prohibitin superfamily)
VGKWLARIAVVVWGLCVLNLVLRLVSMPDTTVMFAGVALALGGAWLMAMLWKLTSRLVILLAVITLTSACARVGPGYAGIKVNQWGSDKGVESYPLVTGTVVYNPFSTDVILYPTFVQTATWTAGSEDKYGDEAVVINSREGLVISCDISLSYQLAKEKVPAFYSQFRVDADGFTHGFLRNVARDAFNETSVQYTVEQIYGEKKEELLVKVKERINAQVLPFGVQIQQFGVLGAMRLPQNVVTALNAKIEAIQHASRVQNEVVQTKAEAEKAVAAAEGRARAQIATSQGEAEARILEAKGRAEANRVLQQSITAQLLQWRALEIQAQAQEKWNGQLPQTIMGGQGAVPFINVNPQR